MMQADVDAEQTALPVHILGVNDIGLESGNDMMTADRTAPWLQPVEGQDIWTLWGVTYRDVIILGPGNEHVGTFNLTVHNLGDPVEYEALKTMLLDAANH